MAGSVELKLDYEASLAIRIFSTEFNLKIALNSRDKQPIANYKLG
jgi:hypothetical protein